MSQICICLKVVDILVKLQKSKCDKKFIENADSEISLSYVSNNIAQN